MPITRITNVEENALAECILPFNYTIASQNSKTATLVVRAPRDDRSAVKQDIESRLSAKGYTVVSDRTGGSIGSTILSYKNTQVKITYKPLSGGMSETTLNSTITELCPALAFMAGKRFTNASQLYNFVKGTLREENRYGCYIDARDKQSGKDFIKQMPTSSKFKEKLNNALAILKYLYDLDNQSKIKQVYFAYRGKPAGIDPNHKGDLFVKFDNGNMLGVSLKAGGERTAEPQLNTYVNKMFDDFDRDLDKTKLKKEVYNKVHSVLGLPQDWESRNKKPNAIDIIEDYKKNQPKQYDSLYDTMLEICRDAVIAAVNKNKSDTESYIIKQVLKKDANVPLVVVKAYGLSYKMVTDEDKLEQFLPRAKTITARKSDTSKQDWFIDLKAGSDTLTMKMAIRTNKPEPNNKIAQGFNLAIKFNGLI